MIHYDKCLEDIFRKLKGENWDHDEEFKRLSFYIEENYKKVSYMDLKELSEKVEVEPRTINELVSFLGYKNYEEFRENLRLVITNELKTTDRFEISMEINSKINEILNRVVNIEMQNIKNLVNTFNNEKLTQLIKEIYDAPEIIVVGSRSSSPIAIYAEYIFNRAGKKTRKIISGGTENFDFLSNVDRNTLVFAFGFARYPKETIKILNFFKKRNFRIISVTDSKTSPLVPLSDKILIISSESLSFTDFFAGPICLINTIIIAISQLNKEDSLKRLNEFESIAKDMEFYF